MVQNMHEGISAKVGRFSLRKARVEWRGTYVAVDENGRGTPNTDFFSSFNCMHMG
jgi:hypothetical protein